jgi:hypothetical protein
MTVKLIRAALANIESNYSVAMDCENFELARYYYDKIRSLQNELVRAICAEDPCTSEADVRYFEGFHDHDEQSAWYDTSAELL